MNLTNGTLTPDELAEAARLPRKTLRRWMRKALFRPTTDESNIPILDESALKVLRAMVSIREDLGLRVAAASAHAHKILESDGDILVVADGEIAKAYGIARSDCLDPQSGTYGRVVARQTLTIDRTRLAAALAGYDILAVYDVAALGRTGAQ